MIHTGDCLEVMAAMPECSVDAIVTDPPYGLEFMGKEWDALGKSGVQRKADGGGGDRRAIVDADEWGGGESNPFSRSRVRWQHGAVGPPLMQEWHERWAREALRVAKPGAYLLAFGGTRTVHRLACAIEDAGWVIRDTLVWAYASGFPKSKNLGNGWGTALKPAWEPIVMARKPLSGSVAENVLRYGTGALNIAATRIAHVTVEGGTLAQNTHLRSSIRGGAGFTPGLGTGPATRDEATNPAGRWPANVVLTDPIFDGGVDGVVGGGESQSGIAVQRNGGGGRIFDRPGNLPPIDGGYTDTGTYSRFFLIPKADRSDREPNAYGKLVGGLVPKAAGLYDDDNYRQPGERRGDHTSPLPRANHHPTVKPVELMRHLVRLVTPIGGTVLDPFAGSGSTLIAAEREGFQWIAIEKEAEYVKIMEARLAGVQRGLGLEAG